MNAKKFLTWFGVAFVTFYVLTSPNDASGVIRSAFDAVESAANQLATFVKSIA